MREVELSQESDRLFADINMRSAFALSQTSDLIRLRSQTVKPLSGVEEEVGLENFVWKIEKSFDLCNFSPWSFDQSVSINDMNLSKQGERYVRVYKNLRCVTHLVPGEEFVPVLQVNIVEAGVDPVILLVHRAVLLDDCLVEGSGGESFLLPVIRDLGEV